MSYNVNATFGQEQAKMEGSYPIEMYVVNASISGHDPLYYVNLDQDVYGYSMNSDGNLGATEVLYSAAKIDRGDIESNIDGKMPTLDISVPNTDRAIEAVIQNNNYLRGCGVWEVTMFADSLPSSSLDYRYLGSSPDRYAALKEKLYIDSTNSNEQVVTFNCTPKFVLRGVVLPLRKFTVGCSWEYLGTECDASGVVASDVYPTCNYTIDQCRERSNDERFGGFVSIPQRGVYV